MSNLLLIFDCDGVLVDSEPISIDLLRRHCVNSGCDISKEMAYKLFLGKPVADASLLVKELLSYEIAPIDLEEFQTDVLDAFRKRLRPVAGVADTLASLPGSKCVASSSNLARIVESLKLTGLDTSFSGRLFSTDMVARGKPHPDVFLYAAAAMGTSPDRAIVIEDSPAGIRAAKSAGMRVVGFYGASHGAPANLKADLAVQSPDALIGNMSELKSTLARLEPGFTSTTPDRRKSFRRSS